MKNYRIRYVIRDGESEYGDEIIKQAEDMNDLTAIRIIAAHWVSWAWRDEKITFSDNLDAFAMIPGEAGEFCHGLLEDDFAMIPGDTRAIRKVSWEEVQPPIVVTLRDGLVDSITHLPAGVCLEVHDFDSGETEANGEPVATVSAWEGPL
jgi:hypothetical protein